MDRGSKLVLMFTFVFSILGHVTGQSATNPTKEALSRERETMEEYKVSVCMCVTMGIIRNTIHAEIFANF